MCVGGCKPRCNCPTVPCSSATGAPRKGLRSRPYWQTCSCTTRSTCGWRGSSRGSGSSAMWMTRSCTASASARPARCWPRCKTGWPRSGCGCIPTRPGSCTARTARDATAFEHTSFTFLGYTFRPRGARAKNGGMFVSFAPAISKDALKKIGQEVRSWRLHRRTPQSFSELARWVNPIVRGWMQYYGAFSARRCIRS